MRGQLHEPGGQQGNPCQELWLIEGGAQQQTDCLTSRFCASALLPSPAPLMAVEGGVQGAKWELPTGLEGQMEETAHC